MALNFGFNSRDIFMYFRVSSVRSKLPLYFKSISHRTNYKTNPLQQRLHHIDVPVITGMMQWSALLIVLNIYICLHETKFDTNVNGISAWHACVCGIPQIDPQEAQRSELYLDEQLLQVCSFPMPRKTKHDMKCFVWYQDVKSMNLKLWARIAQNFFHSKLTAPEDAI